MFGFVHSSLSCYSTAGYEPKPESHSLTYPPKQNMTDKVSRDRRSDSKLNEYIEVKNFPMREYKFARDSIIMQKERDLKMHKVKNLRYILSENESLNSVALKFNMSPNMLKEINGLSSDFIFPGQSLLVPQTQNSHDVAESCSISNNNNKHDMTFFKYPMKRITRFDGSVSGTALITSNAFMFRAHVSEKLVIQKGHNEYNVSIPLDSVSEVFLFESFEEMLYNIQNTTENEFACTKCSEIKHQLVYGRTPPKNDDNNTDIYSEEESFSQSCDSGVLEHNRNSYDINSFKAPLSILPDYNVDEDILGGIQLGMSPVTYHAPCQHEFQGCGAKYSTKVRVNPFTIGDENNRIYIPSYPNLDSCPVSDVEIVPKIRRNESDTSLATKAFFQKIDENTNQMQNMLESTYNHEYSIFISINSIITSRTDGKPSYQQETDEGFKKAQFWICVPDSEVTKIIDNFSELCPQLNNVDDMTNCVLRCDVEHFKTLDDAVLPDFIPKFLPREIATDLLSEPFSGHLNYPPGKTILMTMEMMSELQPYLPCHIVGIDVQLAYSMKIHGMSLRSLYLHCAPYQDVPCLLLVKDTKGYMFGAYLSDGIIESPKYYGSGETFLFRLSPDPTKCYFWQGENHYFMMGTSEYFTVGAGDGNFALYLDEMLQTGTSNRSLTFYNEVLSGSSLFNILTLEVWCFTDEILESGTDSSKSSKLYSGGFVF